MNRSHRWLVARLIGAIGLAGVGHYYVAFQRDIYPLDGYVFYAAAAILFVSALRSVRDWPASDWSALRDPIVQIAAASRRLFRAIADTHFDPKLFLSVIVLNLFAALLALTFSTWIAVAVWVASLVWLAAAVWPRRARVTAPETDQPPSHATIVEPPDTPAARGPVTRVLLLIAGLLMLVLGQLVIGLNEPADSSGGIADLVAEGLRLQLPGAGMALTGLVLLVLSAIVFAVASRGVTQADRPALVVDVRTGRRAGWGGRWLGLAALGLVVWFWVLRSVADGASGLGPLVLWIAALAMIGAVWRHIDTERGVRRGVVMHRREVYGLAVLTIAAFAVWLVQLDRLPASIWGDEGAYWTFARDLASGAVPFNVFGLGTYSYPAGASVFQSIWVSLFGASMWSWRVGSVIAVIATLLPLYFLVRGLLGLRVAFVSLAFFVASPLALTYGRTGYLYAQSILPVTLAALLIVSAIRRDSRLFAFLAGLVSGAGFMLYPSARFGIILGVLILIGFAAARMTRGASIMRIGLSYVSAVILAAGPALAYGLVREPAAFLDKSFENGLANVVYAESVYGSDELLARASFLGTRDNRLFFEPAMYLELTLRGWVRTAIGLHRSGLVTDHYVTGSLAGPLSVLYVLGIGGCLARRRHPGYMVWLIWLFAGTFFLGAIRAFPPYAPDLLPVLPAIAVLAAIGLVGMVDMVQHYSQSLPVWLSIGALAVSAGVVCIFGLQVYFVEMPNRYKPNLEMSMFWSAFDLPRGSTIVFVRDEAYAPDFQPWGLQNFNTGVNWLMIEPAALDETDLEFVCAIDCRVFYTPPYAGRVAGLVREQLGDGSVSQYTNEAGDVTGHAFSPARQR